MNQINSHFILPAGQRKRLGCLCFLICFLLFVSTDVHARKQGQERIDSLLQELPKAKEDSNKVTLFNSIAFLYAPINPLEGIRYSSMGLALAQKIDWEHGIGDAYNQAGICYAYRSEYPKSIDNWINAMKAYEKAGSKRGELKIIGNIGNIYTIQGDYSSALENDLQALKLSEDLDDKSSIAINLGNIGSVYEYLFDYDKAIEYDRKALKMSREMDDKGKIAMDLCNLGNLYIDKKNFDSALSYDFEALKTEKELGDVEGIGRNTLNIGNVYLEQHKYGDALDYGLKAMKMFGDIQFKIGIGKSTKLLANVYLAIAKDTVWNTSHTASFTIEIPENNVTVSSRQAALQKSIEYQEKSIAIDKEVNELDDMQLSYKFLSEAQELSGNYAEALASYKQYHIMNDSVFSASTKVKITNLETRRALQLKDKQIELDRLAVIKKRNERGFFIAGIGLLMAVIFIVFRYYKTQKRLNVLLSAEKQKVEAQAVELNDTLVNLKETQHQLIITEKQKENEIIRSRISQDIHDDISSELTKISWISALAKAKAKKEDYPEVDVLLDKITGYSQETVGKLGEIIWTVNPKNDSLGSLLAYTRGYIAKFLDDTALKYTVDFPGNDTDILINPELKRNLFLVMKEALNNAVKYAQADRIDISFVLHNESYTFAIADNGKGIDEHIVHGGGNGLVNMRQRMTAVKGACIINSQPGKGTRIVLEGILY